ncbi:hypothetical protein, partial [Klebsiella oxytoca]|uniref:hypothetical protein n=1 Tax=Klebsiella oxytoca TaxID=571 RepID=UPI001CCB5873
CYLTTSNYQPSAAICHYLLSRKWSIDGLSICIWGMLAHGAFLFGMNNLIKGSSAQPKGLQN